MTPAEVAEAFEKAVEFKWDALRAHRALQKQAIAALTEKGLSLREVARLLNISKSLVAKQLKEPHFWADDLIPPTPEHEGRAGRTRELIALAWALAAQG